MASSGLALLAYAYFKFTGLSKQKLPFFDKHSFSDGERPFFFDKRLWYLTVTLLLALAVTPAHAEVYRVTTDSAWSNLSPQPTDVDTVVITDGATLTLDVTDGAVSLLWIGCDNLLCSGVSGDGTLLFSASTSELTVTDAVIIGAGVYDGFLDMSNGGVLKTEQWINIKGNFDCGTGSVQFYGEKYEPVIGDETFYDLQLDKSSGDISLNNAITVKNKLTLSAGRLILGSNDLNMEAETVIKDGNDSSYVRANDGGVLRRYLNLNDIGSTFNLAVGDSSYYSPMHFILNNVTLGINPYITIAVYGEAHPQTNTAASHITRYWDLSAANLVSIDYDVEYFYVNDDVVGNEDFWSGRWDGLAWETYETVDATSKRLFVNTGLSTLGSNHNFSGVNGGTLPVELTVFRAEVEDDKVIVEWATATERNSDYFEVQRAVGNENFETLHRVSAAGEATTPRDYRVADTDPPAGKLYYRLRQVDADGTDAYFEPVAVHISPVAQEWNVYPNPATTAGHITLEGAPEDLQEVELLDMSGRTVWHTEVRQSPEKLQVALPHTGAGIYILRLHTPHGLQQKRLLVR